MKKVKGLASAVGIVFIVVGLFVGATAAYAGREPIKKVLTGKNTEEEIDEAVENAGKGQSKFQLEGITTAVDTGANIVTVKIKASTNSIKEMRLSETPISIASSASISQGDEQNLTVADIPIGAQVHIGGEIKDGTLTADKVIIQKETANQGKNFEIEATVKEISGDSMVVTVKASDRANENSKDKDLTIEIMPLTVIEKEGVTVTATDIAAGDKVQIEGTKFGKTYRAAKITVMINEEGAKLDDADQGEDFKNGKHEGFFKKSANANSHSNNGRGNQD